MISKPIIPPWDDSAKNIVRSQLLHSREFEYRVLGTADAEPPAPNVRVDPIYTGAGGYSPGLKQNLKVMLHGLRPRGADIYHYFFAPNLLTSLAGRVQQLLARVKSVQTICSQPKSFDGIGRLLFSDRIVVLSADTENQLKGAGVDPSRIARIRPGIDAPDPPSPESKRAVRDAHGVPPEGPVAIFPGDYEFSSAAETVGDAAAVLAKTHPALTVVFACRIKREPSRIIRDEIKEKIEAAGLSSRVRFLEKVADMPELVGTADVVMMPSESLYAKMDVPLVLLEAMAQGVPLVLADVPPLSELLAYDIGLGVPPGDSEALAEAVGKLLDDDALALAKGRNGATAVRREFSAEAMAMAMERIYNEVLEK
jgi:phosphatidylinositol alpha-1,6-mannosyltransferase